MDTAIQLHNQPVFMAYEIDDVRPERRLSSKMQVSFP